MIVFFFFISISIFLFLAINLHKTKKQSYQIQNDLTILKDILYTSPNGYYFEYQFQDDIFSYCSDKLCLLLNVKDKKTSFSQLIKSINFNDYQSVLNAFSDLKEYERSFDIEITDDTTHMHFSLNGRVIYSSALNKKLFIVWFNNQSFKHQQLICECNKSLELSDKINIFSSALNLIPFPIEITKNDLKFTNSFFNQHTEDLSNFYWNEHKTSFDNHSSLLLKYGQDKTTEEGLQVLLNDAESTYKHLLKELPFGVSLFDSAGKLKFFNSKFSNIWSLDISFLKKEPAFADILDKIQEKNLLLHIKDFSKYKKEALETFLNLTNIHEEFLYLDKNQIVKQKMLVAPKGGILILTEEKTISGNN